MKGLLACAVDCVNRGELSIRKAAAAFGVSYTTLWSRLRGVCISKIGRPRHFTADQEQKLVDLVVSCEKCGIAMSKRILLCVVRNAAINTGICWLPNISILLSSFPAFFQEFLKLGLVAHGESRSFVGILKFPLGNQQRRASES